MTRATLPGEDRKDRAQFRRQVSTEPFAVTLRRLSEKNVKIIHWFVTLIKEGETQLQDTRMPSENYDAVFFDAEEAVERLSSSDHRELVKKAIQLVRDLLPDP